jgi:RNA polymerase sigma factor (sigma-70 family)
LPGLWWIEVAPATPFERLSSRDELEELLERLDDLGRAVFVHLHLDGLTQEEIAQVTGVTRRTIGKGVKQIEQLLAGAEEVTP